MANGNNGNNGNNENNGNNGNNENNGKNGKNGSRVSTDDVITPKLTGQEKIAAKKLGEPSEYNSSSHDKFSVVTDENGAMVEITGARGRANSQQERDESLIVQEDGSLRELNVYKNGTEVCIYEDSDGDGNYRLVSKQFLPSFPDAVLENEIVSERIKKVQILEELRFEGTSDDDLVLLSEEAPVIGGEGADDFVYRDVGDAQINDFSVESGDQIVFDLGLGLSSTDELAAVATDVQYSEVDQTLMVEFGDTATLTVVGLVQEDISWDLVTVLS